MKATRLTKIQAQILRSLLSFDEIRERDGGFFMEGTQRRISIKAVNGLISRGMMTIRATHTMPSSGLLASPVLNNESITKKGRDAIVEYIAHLDWRESPDDWRRDIERGLKETEEAEK